MQAEKNITGKTFWAITSYFNPSRYERRLQNYRIFRDHLEIPLIAVELSFTGNFELQSDDADILIQLNSSHVMWQKERLLNIALQYLPEVCDKVAWLDCDIVFGQHNWASEAKRLLDTHTIIQPFEKIMHLPSEAYHNSLSLDEMRNTPPIVTEYSYAYHCTKKKPATGLTRCGHATTPLAGKALGVAWAMRKELLLELGFYDYCVAGGGDTAIALAACGKMADLPAIRPMNSRQVDHYLKWANRYYASVLNNLSFIPTDVYHLWHGDFRNRSYKTRHKKLKDLNFDPNEDIEIAPNGCLQWKNGKTELYEYLKGYFEGRKEDG